MTAGVKRGKSRSLHQTAWLVGDLIEHWRRLKRLCTCIGNQDRARIGVMQALNRHVERVFNRRLFREESNEQRSRPNDLQQTMGWSRS